MAITITSGTPNISDNASYTVTYTGATTGTNIKTYFYLRVNSTTIQTISTSNASGSIAFTPYNVKSALYDAAYGASLSGTVQISASNYNTSTGAFYGSDDVSGGNLTITYRLSNFTGNGLNVNLDGNSNIGASWTNSYTGKFMGIYTVTVDGTTIGNSGLNNTYYDYAVNPGTDWYNNFNTAIGSSASKTITYSLATYFRSSYWQYLGGSGSLSGTVTKTQSYPGTLTSFNDYTVQPGVTVSYSGTEGGGTTGITYSLELKIGSTVIVGQTNMSSVGSSISLTTDQVNAAYAALNGSASATSTLVLATYVNGTWIGQSSRTATVYNVVAAITSFTNTERAGTSLSYAYAVDTAVDLAEYKIGSTGTYVNISSSTHTSGTFQITGLAPSTSYTVYIRVRHATSQQYTVSSGLTVLTVNTSIITNTPNFNIDSAGVSIPLEISKVNASMLHTVTLKNTAETTTYGTSASNIDTTGTITLTAGAIDSLYAVTANSATVNLVLVCESFLSGVSQGFTRKAIVATVVNANPTIGSAAYLDTNSTIQAIISDNQSIVQNLSNMEVIGYSLASNHYATLTQLVVNFGGYEYTVALAGNSVASQVLDAGAINVADSGIASVYVVDSRGYVSTSYQMPITMIAYTPPLLTLYELSRRNNYYEDAYVNAKYKINSVYTNSTEHNTVAVQYRYKLSSDTVWSAWENVTNPTPDQDGYYLVYTVDNEHATPSPIPVNYTFNINSVYNVEYQISDTFTTTPVVFTNYVPKGMGHIEFYEDRVNFGVQPYFTNLASEEKLIYHEDNIGPALLSVMTTLYPVGSIYITTLSANPSTYLGFGTWNAYAEGRTIVGVGTSDVTYTEGSTGGESTHTLITDEMPTHTHIQDAHNHTQSSHSHTGSTGGAGGHDHQYYWDYDGAGGSTRYTISHNSPHGGSDATSWVGDHSHSVSIGAATAVNQSTTATNQNTGGDAAHNNMPPYIVTYIWERTA